MGIIAKQSVKGSIYTYAGVFLGFIGTGILMPKFFTTEQVGLTSMLIAVTLLFSQFATLGFTSVNTRIFPFFRNNENGHNGLLKIGLSVTLAGILLSLFIFFLFKNKILEGSSGKSNLMGDYSVYFIPLFFFTAYFIFFDSYAKALFDSLTGTILRDFIVKLLNLILIIVYVSDFIDFEFFIISYIIVYILPAIIILILLLIKKQIIISKPNTLLLHKHKSEIIQVSLYGILSGFTGVAAVNIDTIFTNFYLGLSFSGIYGIVFYTASLILKPSLSLRKISSIVIAEAWKINDLVSIKMIYYKSTINQMIIGLFLFGGIFINIDNFFRFIPEYSAGSMAMLILTIGFLSEMLSGVSGIILSVSSYYKFSSVLSIFSIASLAVFCIIFIPGWKIEGTAFAVSVNYFLFAIIRYFFLFKKFRFQPYGKKHLIIILIFGIALGVSDIIPEMQNFIFDFLARSSLFTLLFLIPVYYVKVSEDFNLIFIGLFKKLFSVFNKFKF